MPNSTHHLADEITGQLSPIVATTPSAAVAAKLLKYFTSGGMDVGTRLPPERQLAEMFGTGRSAVREALAALEILGVVQIRPGSGTYLRGGVSELLPQTLSWGLMLGERSVGDLVQVRSALELLATELAAQRIDDGALRQLGENLAAMENHRDDQAAFVEADMHFHQALATASGNVALDGLLQSVRSLLRIWVDRAVRDESEITAAIAEHREVLDALARRDVADAHKAMASHMRTAGQRVQRAAAE